MTTDTMGMSLLTSPMRREIIEILANLPLEPTDAEPHPRAEGLTASEIGHRVGLHLTTVRFHVDQLLASDLLIAHDVRSGVGRPRRHYAVNPGNLPGPESTRTYALLAELLSDSFSDALASGRPQTAADAASAWIERHHDDVVPEGLALAPAKSPGHFLAKVGAVVDVLQAWGYTATVKTTEDGHTAEIGLGRCPIRELAQHNPGVACGIHRELIRAALAEVGEPDASIGLTPFVEPDLCVARLTARHLSNQEKK